MQVLDYAIGAERWYFEQMTSGILMDPSITRGLCGRPSHRIATGRIPVRTTHEPNQRKKAFTIK
jgi:hypothetical protein